MHSVNGDEFFGEGVGDVVVVDSRPRDATDNLAGLRNSPKCLRYLFAYEAPPIRIQSDFNRRVM